MSTHSDDDDEDSSQYEDDQDIYQQDEGDYNDQEQNAFVTDDADVQLASDHQLGEDEEMEPIEARPPEGIDADEQERHQSGTPAFRTLDDVCYSSFIDLFYLVFFLVIQRRSTHWYTNGPT